MNMYVLAVVFFSLLQTAETDGQTHSSVKRVPNSAAGEGGKAGRREGEKGEDEDVMGRELEDTLKASDHKRMMRNMSSPPGINYDGDPNRPLTQTEMRDVHLRSKIQTSQSLDTLTKVDIIYNIHDTIYMYM